MESDWGHSLFRGEDLMRRIVNAKNEEAKMQRTKKRKREYALNEEAIVHNGFPYKPDHVAPAVVRTWSYEIKSIIQIKRVFSYNTT